MRGGAHAPDDAHGFGVQETFGFRPPDDRKPARFIKIGRDLGEEFVVAQADRAGQAKLSFHIAGQAGQKCCRGLAVQAGSAGEVKECLIEGQRFNRGCQRLHHRPDGAGGFGIGGETGLHDHGVGAQLQRLKHRHGGPHARDAGDVAAGGNDPPCAAANDQGHVT